MKKSEGFTLVEAVVAMGVLAILMLGFLSMFEMNAKGTRGVTQASDAQALANLIQLDLMYASACTNTFVTDQAISFPYPPAPGLKVDVAKVFSSATPGAVIAQVGPNPAAPFTAFNSVMLSNTPAAYGMTLQNFIPQGSPPTAYLADFVVTATGIGSALGSPSYVRRFPVSFPVSIAGATATVTGCYTAGAGGGGGAPSLGQFQCQQFTQSANTSGNVTATCNSSYPYAMNGGCSSPGRIDINTLSGNAAPGPLPSGTAAVQTCHQNGGNNVLTSTITCCQ